MHTRYKRPFDLILLISSHIVMFPIFAFLWFAIPLIILVTDGKPIFFHQPRIGKDGKTFTMIKFRSMTKDALKTGPGWTEADDPRITKIGGFLRRTALDELPQLFSILKGDMSFVGPRAKPAYQHDVYLRELPNFNDRLKVPPGATGYSLINLPRHCSPKEILHWDLKYINEASALLDIKLVAITILISLAGQWGKGKRQSETGATFCMLCGSELVRERNTSSRNIGVQTTFCPQEERHPVGMG